MFFRGEESNDGCEVSEGFFLGGELNGGFEETEGGNDSEGCAVFDGNERIDGSIFW